MKCGILYLCIHKRIKELADFENKISFKDFCCVIGKEYHVPKTFRSFVAKEMEEAELIERAGKIKNFHIKILPSKYNID